MLEALQKASQIISEIRHDQEITISLPLRYNAPNPQLFYYFLIPLGSRSADPNLVITPRIRIFFLLPLGSRSADPLPFLPHGARSAFYLFTPGIQICGICFFFYPMDPDLLIHFFLTPRIQICGSASLLTPRIQICGSSSFLPHGSIFCGSASFLPPRIHISRFASFLFCVTNKRYQYPHITTILGSS